MLIESILDAILQCFSFGHLPSDTVEILTYFSSLASEVNEWINLSELFDLVWTAIGMWFSIIVVRLLIDLL